LTLGSVLLVLAYTVTASWADPMVTPGGPTGALWRVTDVSVPDAGSANILLPVYSPVVPDGSNLINVPSGKSTGTRDTAFTAFLLQSTSFTVMGKEVPAWIRCPALGAANDTPTGEQTLPLCGFAPRSSACASAPFPSATSPTTFTTCNVPSANWIRRLP